MLINYFLMFLALLMLIFAAVAILYVGLEGDIFVYPTTFFLEHVPRQFNLYFMLQWNLNIVKLYIMKSSVLQTIFLAIVMVK